MMEEQLSLFSIDEPETFVGDQLYDGTLCHAKTPSKKKIQHRFSTRSPFQPRKIAVER
jgi:hypothetical protein